MIIQRISRVTGIVLLAALTLPSPDAHAAWPDDPATSGVPVCSRPTSETLKAGAVIEDGAGGTIVVWEDTRSGAQDLYAQRLSGLGDPQWDVDGVPVCTAAGIQRNARIVSDGGGGAIVAWEDARSGSYDIYAQRVNAGGVPQWTSNGVTLVAAANDQVTPSMSSDGAGGAIVAWEDRRLGLSEANIHAQRITAAGAAVWVLDGLAISTAVGREFFPAVASDDAGGACIAWASNEEMRAQRVAAAGTVSWASGGVFVTSASGFHTDPRIVHVGGGVCVIAWEDQPLGPIVPWNQRAQKLSATGVRQWGNGGIEICPQDSSQVNARMVGDGAGGAIVAWELQRNFGDSSNVHAQRIDGAGGLPWGAAGVAVCTAVRRQASLAAAPDGAGGVLLAWMDQRLGGPDLYAQRLNSAGVAQWTSQGSPICSASSGQSFPEMAAMTGGWAVIAWIDTRQGSNDVYAQLLRLDGQLGLVPTVGAADRLVSEGSSGSTLATFQVTLSWPTSRTVTVNWATADGTATSASGDFAPSATSVVIAPNTLSAPAHVIVYGDSEPEADETFSITLSGATNATLTTPSATATILDDDAPQLVGPNSWVTNGTVNAMVESGGTIYVGGSFSRMGPPTGGGVPVDAASGQPLALPRVAGEVFATVSDGAGGWYLGGDFTHVAGMPRRNLAHLRSDHTLSAWNPMADGVVQALTRIGAVVYAGGEFTVVDGRPRQRLAAMDAAGVATPWNPGANGRVLALAAGAGTIHAGGEFTLLGGKPRNRIGAIDPAGAVTSWNPDANDEVQALAVNGGTVYAGGRFTILGGQPRNRIAVMRGGSAAADPTWNPNAQAYVSTLALSGATLYAGGFFNAIGGQSRRYVAALDTTSGLATAWNPDADHAVNALATSGGTVYLGGFFDAIGGQPRQYVAAVDAGTGLVTSWDPGPGDIVYALAATPSTVFVGGMFEMQGALVRENLAALDAATGNPTSWNPGADQEVRALAVSGATVYAGGLFTTVGSGVVRRFIAAFDASSGAATAWDPNANGPVLALAVSGSTVYAGGSFTNIGGTNRNRLAALDVNGIALSWNPNPNGAVHALAVGSGGGGGGGLVYAGGAFTTMGSLARNRIAALNTGSGTATTWNPNADGAVDALVVSGSQVYAGGSFDHVGGQSRPGLAALNTAGAGTATTWIPDWLGGVKALAVNGSTIYVGGLDLAGDGNLAALHTTTGLASPWLPIPDDAVRALAVAAGAGAVHVGGDFNTVGGLPRAGMVLIAPAGLVSVPIEGAAAGLELVLGPNPAAGRVHIRLALPRASHTTIGLYDVMGRLVSRLVDRELPAGTHTITMHPSLRKGAGVYFVRLEAAGRVLTRRLVVLR